ncbi:glutamate-rich protein 6B isoform X1 [Equus przewalskii]|uniref:Glutamate rich 6B n=2 Tax=Equus TaxID=9789 RepID=A0A9L0RFA1_HORSE|nr:glutamate-rich protein 6B isoform X1 [Equus caballus]XP_005601293.1 glutamate-rich protein 6B isoform X1 [Equus caballus]XP_008515167.1 PREDICTED: glutamate-rich protein 6B [Equus przewalskii]XP_008515168.1 PREDICTED: glutamate-rich protein 6B [Equus przewalskii]
MSAESNQPPGRSPPPHPPTLSQNSTQIFSSEEEDPEGDESSGEESPLPEEEENLEENGNLEEENYLEEDEYLKGKEYLYEQEYLKKEKDLQEEKRLKDKEGLHEKLLEEESKMTSSSQTLPYLNARSPAAGPSWVSTFFTVPASISEPGSKSPHYDTTPPASSVEQDREFLAWQDRSTQTEWIYDSLSAASKLRLTSKHGSPTMMLMSDLEACGIPEAPQEQENAMEFVSQGSFWDRVLNEPIETLEMESFSNNVFSSSYQSVFRTMIEAMAARSELEEDVDIPLTGHLEGETRRKLGILLKKNFEKYREIFTWFMKKREILLNTKAAETITFRLLSQPAQVKEPVREVKKTNRVVRHKKKLEVDTEWVKVETKVHKGDGKLILYPSEKVFQILFPDGSGQIYYPSGNLAMLVLSTKETVFTYIILEDSKEKYVRALVSSSGHATFYDENREIRLNLSQTLCYYFPQNKRQLAWNWWDLGLHVHAPPFRSISLKINRYIKVQIRSQEKIIFHFIYPKKHVCLNLGTKYKFISPEFLSEMKKKEILEMEFGSTAQKIRILLRKMSKILNFLTVSDLEDFIEATKTLLEEHKSLRRTSYVSGTRSSWGFSSICRLSQEGGVIRSLKENA